MGDFKQYFIKKAYFSQSSSLVPNLLSYNTYYALGYLKEKNEMSFRMLYPGLDYCPGSSFFTHQSVESGRFFF